MSKPEDNVSVTTEELLANIEETAKKMDANLKRRIEWKGSTVAQVWNGKEGASLGRPIITTTLIVLGMMSLVGGVPIDTFTAYHCTNRSIIVEPYSLLEPSAYVASDGNGEIETNV